MEKYDEIINESNSVLDKDGPFEKSSKIGLYDEEAHLDQSKMNLTDS